MVLNDIDRALRHDQENIAFKWMKEIESFATRMRVLATYLRDKLVVGHRILYGS